MSPRHKSKVHGGSRFARPRVLLALGAVVAFAALSPVPAGPSRGAPAGGNPSADLDQCKNGTTASPVSPCDWVNGNLGTNNSHYADGDSVPFRIRFDNLATTGTHTVVLEWDTTKAGKHAYDYLTTYNQTESNANPCQGVGTCTTASPSSTLTIAPDPNVTASLVTPIPGAFTMWKGTLTSASLYSTSGSYGSDSSTRLTLTFTATSSNPVLAWAGHVASDLDWGTGTTASTISGSPYHMRLLALDGVGGNQDRSLKVTPGPVPGSITIVKQATPEGARQFNFTSSDNGAFSLVDDGNDATAPFNAKTFDNLTDFYTPTGLHTYDFTEAVPTGWALSSITCSSGTDFTTTSATLKIKLTEGTNVVCTFVNDDVVPTITVTKTPTPSSVPETGGTVSYAVSVTNNSTAESVTLTALDDDKFSDVTAISGTTCSTPQTIGPSGTYTCSFSKTLTGDAGGPAHVNTIEASVTDDEGNTITDTDDATVVFTDTLPLVTVTKTPTPTSVSESGALVVFALHVTNGTAEPVTLYELDDSDFGDVTTKAPTTCVLPQSLAGNGTYDCTFTAFVDGDFGTDHENTITASVRDDETNQAHDTDDATVAITDTLPVITVVKTASATSVHTGASVTYTYEVTTVGTEELSNITVVDDKCSPAAFVSGDTDTDSKLDPGETWTYTCTSKLTTTTVNTATATGEDDEGNTASDTDSATVDVLDPKVAIDKVANPKSATPGDTVTYTYTVTNPGNQPLSDVVVVDDKCSPVAYVSGDTDNDAKLDTTETWTYTCSVVVGTSAGALTNVATVTAKDPTGLAVSAQDTETIAVVEAVVIERPRVLGVDLPRTGAALGGMAATGTGLVFGGFALFAVGRRRRVQSQ